MEYVILIVVVVGGDVAVGIVVAAVDLDSLPVDNWA